MKTKDRHNKKKHLASIEKQEQRRSREEYDRALLDFHEAVEGIMLCGVNSGAVKPTMSDNYGNHNK